MIKIIATLFSQTAATSEDKHAQLKTAVFKLNDDIVDGMIELLKQNIIPRIRTFERLYGYDLFAKKFLKEKNSNRYRTHKDSLKLIFDVKNYKFEPGPMKYKELGEWICSRAAKYLDLKLEIYKTNGMNRWFMSSLEGNFNILKQIHHLFLVLPNDPLQNFPEKSEDDIASKYKAECQVKNQIESITLQSRKANEEFGGLKRIFSSPSVEEQNLLDPALGNFNSGKAMCSVPTIYPIPPKYQPYNIRGCFLFTKSDTVTNRRLANRNYAIKTDFFKHVSDHYLGIYIGKEIDRLIYSVQKINEGADQFGVRFGLVSRAVR